MPVGNTGDHRSQPDGVVGEAVAPKRGDDAERDGEQDGDDGRVREEEDAGADPRLGELYLGGAASVASNGGGART